MDDYPYGELLDAYTQADKLADLADMYANSKEYRLAAINYSRALGLLMAAVDTVLATDEKVSA